MTDVEILSMAIDASGKTARQFATDVLAVEDRSVRRWLAGRGLPGTVRVLCMAITLRPALADEIVAAHEKIVIPC